MMKDSSTVRVIHRPVVLILSTNADTAGAPIHVETIVRALQSEFELHCIFGEEGIVANNIRQLGIPVYIVNSLRSPVNPLRDARCVYAVNRLCRQIKPDIIHAHSAKAGLMARSVARWHNIPCLYTVHGWGFGVGRPRLQSMILKSIELMMAYASPAEFLYVSQADADQARDELGISPARGRVIHNGIPDHHKCADPLASANILMVSRVAFQKDHETLVRAYEESGIGHLILAGDGTTRPDFNIKLSEWSPKRRSGIELLGVRTDIPDLLGQVGVFALASRYEGLPISIIEAMCAGLPIVATDVGGVRELVVDGDNGFLVPPGDVGRFAACLKALGNPELRDAMGKASRKRYEQFFSIETMVSAVKQAYTEVLPTGMSPLAQQQELLGSTN